MRSLLREELRTLFHNKKLLIPVIAVLFIPILYSGMFLWAFWDPYDHLDDLPVVVVNEDDGAQLDGDEIKLGNDLLDKLKDSHKFDFHFADKEQAYKDLKNQKYYLLVEIPEDFSQNATTLMDENPQKLNLIYVPNESYNFLSSQIGETAIKEIKSSISDKVSETYAETIFANIENMAEGLDEASQGAGKLSDGSADLKDGSALLHDKLSELASKSIEFNQGVENANSGSQELASGSSKLETGLSTIDAKLPLLIEGANKAYSGAEQMKEQLPGEIAKEVNNQLAGSAVQLNQGIDQFESQLGTAVAAQIAQQTINQQTAQMQELSKTLVANGVPKELVAQIMQKEQQNAATKDQVQQQILTQLEPSLNQGFSQFKSSVNEQLLGSTSSLEGKIKDSTDPVFNELISGIGTIDENQKVLQKGIHDAYSGSAELNEGTNTLSSGLSQLAEGSNKITEGTGQLAEGAKTVADGNQQLFEGNQELADKLGEGAGEAASVHADDKTYDMVANPVVIKNEKLNEVPNYGTGFAPYFISLGLFVGALIISIVFPLREPAIVPKNAFSWFASKFTILAGIGILQGLIASIVLLSTLHLEVKSVPLFILMAIVTSLTFMALIQFLVTSFGDVGRFVAILILIFQLTTSAGTFPLEVIPSFLQHFNAYLPMTYTVQAFKAVISSGNFGFMWENATFLGGFVLVFMLGSLFYFNMRHKRQFATMVKETSQSGMMLETNHN